MRVYGILLAAAGVASFGSRWQALGSMKAGLGGRLSWCKWQAYLWQRSRMVLVLALVQRAGPAHTVARKAAESCTDGVCCRGLVHQ